MYTKCDKLLLHFKLIAYKNIIVILVDETKYNSTLVSIFPSIMIY